MKKTFCLIFVLIFLGCATKEMGGALNHPSSKLIAKADSLENYEHLIKNYLSDQKLRHELTKGESYSLEHQEDLLNALNKNPELLKQLEELNFSKATYLRGVYDSDLGKLNHYKELFTKEGPKSDLLFSFAKGQGPKVAVDIYYEILKDLGLPLRPLLNPETSDENLRKLFENYPLLKGYLHELPGMVDAILSFNKGLLNRKQLKEQLQVNLFHCGPKEGYWAYLENHLIPAAFKDDHANFLLLFKGSYHERAESKNLHLHYGRPSSFESYVAAYFDRLSQATRTGYYKISEEIKGDPIQKITGLLLGPNITGTSKQLKKMIEYIDNSPQLNQNQKKFLKNLTQEGITYLENYQNHLNQALKVSTMGKNALGQMTLFLKEKKLFIQQVNEDTYLINGTERVNQKNTQKLINGELLSLFNQIEKELGDPFFKGI